MEKLHFSHKNVPRDMNHGQRSKRLSAKQMQ